jgi:GNAT superfamily N-acetyltransferase
VSRPDLPPGWATDLAVLEHTGSVIEDRGDHLVVRTPRNPGYHWGHVVFVTDGDAVRDADKWIGTFREAHPEADWIAIGLIRMPEDQSAWLAHGMELELDEVLTTRTLPVQKPLADGYTVRRLDGDDWSLSVARLVADNARTGEHDPGSHERFAERLVQARRELSERGVAAFFGAFSGGALVAELGIVRCGTTARYQSVGTEPEHRRRGLAAHLLGVAARWSAEGGCDRWVIITEATNPAGRVYRGVGFKPDVGNAQAYRKPPR